MNNNEMILMGLFGMFYTTLVLYLSLQENALITIENILALKEHCKQEIRIINEKDYTYIEKMEYTRFYKHLDEKIDSVISHTQHFVIRETI